MSFSIHHNGSAVRNIVIHKPNVVVIHPQATVADGEADAGVVIAVRVHGPILQAGVESITRGAVETNDGTAVVRAIVPSRLLIGSGEHASNGRCSCLLYTSPSPRDAIRSRMPSSA